MKAAALMPATRSQTRNVVPFYTLDTEIRLPTGELLYPRGYSFNPLAYVTLPQRLVVVHPRDLGWALKTARLTDFILLAAGSARDDDAITLSERTGRAIFILEERVKDRLNLTVAPVIIAQIGQRLELTEVRLERTARGAPYDSQPARRPVP
jgi:conjugal transfer pilus assembly protein TraW